MNEPQTTYLDRGDNPFFGGHQASNIIEGTIVKVHTDEANNVTMTCDVVTIKNETKTRVPFLFPYASASGRAGIFAIPNVGDKCLLALVAGNLAYVVGYHPTSRLNQGRASASLASSGTNGQSLKGTFAESQLIPGSIEIKSPFGNRVLVHPGGSIAIDARRDLFTFYDAVSATFETLCRQHKTFTAGGQVLWTEGQEKSKRSMSLAGTFFTKSATKENLDAGELRGGARMTVLFSEQANHFFLEVKDKDDITSRIALGPNGIILTSSDGSTSTSISLAPGGNFALIAGPPTGLHTELSIAPTAIAITAKSGTAPLATVLAETNGKVTVSAQTQVILSAPKVVTQDGLTNLGALGGLGVARKIIDRVIVFGVMGGSGSASGFVQNGSGTVTAAG